MSADVPGHGGGEGLIKYITGNPFVMFGILIAPMMLAGLVLAIRRDRTTIALQALAVLQIVVLGLTTHAQARFVFLATVLLVILGVDAIRRKVSAKLAPLAAVAVLGAWIATLVAGVQWSANARTAKNAPTVLAALTLRADAAGRECAVLGRHSAQLEWYGGCPSTSEILVGNLSLDIPVYGVIEDHSDLPLRDSLPGERCSLAVPAHAAEVLRLQPPGTACARPKP
jgi:hypothetical protein